MRFSPVIIFKKPVTRYFYPPIKIARFEVEKLKFSRKIIESARPGAGRVHAYISTSTKIV